MRPTARHGSLIKKEGPLRWSNYGLRSSLILEGFLSLLLLQHHDVFTKVIKI